MKRTKKSKLKDQRLRERANVSTKRKKKKLLAVILQHVMDVLNDGKSSPERKDKISRWAIPYVAYKVTDPARLRIAARKIKHRERRVATEPLGKKQARKAAAEAVMKKKTGKWGNLLAGAGVERGNDIRV